MELFDTQAFAQIPGQIAMETDAPRATLRYCQIPGLWMVDDRDVRAPTSYKNRYEAQAHADRLNA